MSGEGVGASGKATGMFDQIKKFLLEYDLQKLMDLLRNVDWHKTLSIPEVWFVGVPVLGLLVWKRKFRLMLFLASIVAFTFLIPLTLPAKTGDALPLEKLLMFLGGSLALVLINLYFVFIRRD
jgi:hypothetical protein